MSAWIVGRAHIDVLVQGLAESETVTEPGPDELGRILWRENLASVAARYPSDGDGERPGPNDFRDDDVDTYTYRRPRNKIDQGGLLVALACYEYQSCEHPGWATSQAYGWTAQLVGQLKRAGARMPGSGARMEAWGYEEATVHGTEALSA